MRKYLNGSAGTGEKIIKHFTFFKYDFVGKESDRENKTIYRFKWHFYDYQHGYINIIVQNNSYCIDEGSTMGTDDDSPKKFDRPLGLYNDKTLESVYRKMMSCVK
ncbi:MAG: hypothetical protein E7197_04600 [Anaerovibrio sp.]|uniref:hypothetical protein n=1 Tax=Anaerovibrio sp. TaxID=1872532 RepID=UPI0025C4CF4C|nr:hypothetical protein [Anaerovibrio sp.]MBE6099314.1 hypothetical protein [Anaerovibrio sp.]